tara:strand:- start:249 stop:524 length:276 start_codon:yes stop_codon:yes gene_type:complete
MSICPEVNGKVALTDIQCFEAFNVTIDENGNDLWAIKPRSAGRNIGKRELPESNDGLLGKAGSEERIEWLRSFYSNPENHTKEESPFNGGI